MRTCGFPKILIFQELRKKCDTETEKKEENVPASETRRQRVKQDPIVFSWIFCFWQMKNVNCPVCIWEFLHYSSASLVPAAPSPWQLLAPCSQLTHTHTPFSDCVVAMVRWLTHSLTSEALVCKHETMCVCVYGSLIFEKHTIHTHACCLSKGCELLVAQHKHTPRKHTSLLCSLALQLARLRLRSPQPGRVKSASPSVFKDLDGAFSLINTDPALFPASLSIRQLKGAVWSSSPIPLTPPPKSQESLHPGTKELTTSHSLNCKNRYSYRCILHQNKQQNVNTQMQNRFKNLEIFSLFLTHINIWKERNGKHDFFMASLVLYVVLWWHINQGNKSQCRDSH